MENVKKKMTSTGINDFDYFENSVRKVILKFLRPNRRLESFFMEKI